MDLEEILHKLEEAVELEDWDMVIESIDHIRVISEESFGNLDVEEW
jgi:hypothetical protein